MSESAACQEYVTLANGVRMPSVAFGCAFGNWVDEDAFQGFLPEQAWRALSLGWQAGYRAFDGAHAYGTESILGSVLGTHFATGEIERSDIFITTKLAHPSAPPHVNISHLRTWDANQVPDISARVQHDMMTTLEDLKLGYVDLLLMHWPGPFANRDAGLARRARKTIWQTFAELHAKGAARAVGVSNFTAEHISQLMEDVPDLRPLVNQIEVHPYCRDPELEQFCRDNDIVVSAYAPFASGAFNMLRDPVLTAAAERHGVSTGQVVLRWNVQSGRTVLPKSSNLERMRQNLDLFRFSLTEAEMQAIDQLGDTETRRTCPDPHTVL